jgi:hypothetical protein
LGHWTPRRWGIGPRGVGALDAPPRPPRPTVQSSGIYRVWGIGCGWVGALDPRPRPSTWMGVGVAGPLLQFLIPWPRGAPSFNFNVFPCRGPPPSIFDPMAPGSPFLQFSTPALGVPPPSILMVFPGRDPLPSLFDPLASGSPSPRKCKPRAASAVHLLERRSPQAARPATPHRPPAITAQHDIVSTITAWQFDCAMGRGVGREGGAG